MKDAREIDTHTNRMAADRLRLSPSGNAYDAAGRIYILCDEVDRLSAALAAKDAENAKQAAEIERFKTIEKWYNKCAEILCVGCDSCPKGSQLYERDCCFPDCADLVQAATDRMKQIEQLQARVTKAESML